MTPPSSSSAPSDTAGRAPSALPADPITGHEEALRTLLPSKEALLAEVQRSRRSRRTRRATLAVALLLAGGVALDPSLYQEELVTAVGEQRVLTLGDGSTVRLNTASAVRVQAHLRSRQVRLLGGEAYFSVAHGWRPFYVHYQDVRVEDIGTRFVTQSVGDAGLSVSVTEGAVEVRQAQDRVLLTTGQGLLARPHQMLEPMADVPAPSWIDGRLAFEGVRLRDAVAQLQRYRSGRLTLDAAAADLRLTADYDVAGVEAMIRDMPAFLPVELVPGPSGELHIRRVAATDSKKSPD